jgi:hypothetical protein
MTNSRSLSSQGDIIETDESETSVTSKSTQDLSSLRVILAQKESNLVWRSRIVVLLVLLVATVSVSIATYHGTELEEQKDFKTRVSIIQLFTCERSGTTNILLTPILLGRSLYSSKILQIR